MTAPAAVPSAEVIHESEHFTIEVYADVPTWERARAGGIGGSDAAAVWGCSPWASPFSLWCDKVHGVRDFSEGEWLEIGHELEVPIARLWSKRTGFRAVNAGKNVLLRSKRWPHMTYSLDFAAYRDATKNDPGILEVKNRGAYAMNQWEKEGVPLYVVLQVIHGYIVTGWSWGHVAALIGGNTFRHFPVARDEELIQLHIEKCATFWCNHVLASLPPETDGSDATGKALGQLYVGTTGEIVKLGDEAVPYVVAWDQAHAEQKEAEKEAEAAKARKAEAAHWLEARIGAGKAGMLPDGTNFSLIRVRPGRVEAHDRAGYQYLKRKGA